MHEAASDSRTAPIKKGSFRGRREPIHGGPRARLQWRLTTSLFFVERYLGAFGKNILFDPAREPFSLVSARLLLFRE
jgi:hypothetical protein